jgi:3-hydroxybutyryl-CoA dehydrogenase
VPERVAIAGTGAIACGLAQLVAHRGDVVMLARSSTSAERADEELRLRLRSDEQATGKVRVTTDPADLRDATLLVEAVAEEHAVKAAVLGTLAKVAGDGTLIATTTSSLSVTELSLASGHHDRFFGFHVFNPVTKMALVELIFPTRATDDTRERAVTLTEALGKTPVVVPDMPGFVVNRLLFPYLFSAVELLEDTGMTPADVDRCMTLGAGQPLGPLALLDFVGLDVALAIGHAIDRPVPLRLRTLVDDGMLGRKTGKGFHSYPSARS